MYKTDYLGILRERRDDVLYIEWQIDCFLSLPSHPGAFHCSPVFQFSNSFWRMKIYPYGEKKGDASQDSIAMYLVKKNSLSPEVVTFKFGVKRVDGSLHSTSPLIWKYINGEGYGHPEIVKRSELLETFIGGQSKYLHSQAFIATITLKRPFPPQERNTLHGGLKNILDNKMHCDLTINVGPRVFHGHKVILAACSPVFAAMFKHDMSEKKSGVLKIEDCDPGSFETFLHFLYSGQVTINESNMFELFRTADKYCVYELKTYCVAYMMHYLSVDNVFDVVMLAESYAEVDLYNFCSVFFEDHIRNILLSPTWELFLEENYLVANKLLKAVAPKIVIKK